MSAKDENLGLWYLSGTWQSATGRPSSQASANTPGRCSPTRPSTRPRYRTSTVLTSGLSLTTIATGSVMIH